MPPNTSAWIDLRFKRGEQIPLAHDAGHATPQPLRPLIIADGGEAAAGAFGREIVWKRHLRTWGNTVYLLTTWLASSWA